MKIWDAIIVGGGIIGLSLARELSRRSFSVLVIERGEPGREASHAAAGMLVDGGFETPPELRPLAAASARMYPEFAHELEDESGAQVDLRDHGSIVFCEPGEAVPEGASLNPQRLAELEPYIAPRHPLAFFVEERSIDPRALLEAALKACKHRGVDIVSGSPVLSVEIETNRVKGVLTPHGRYHAPVVVACAGAWSAQLEPSRFPTHPVKGQMLAVAMPGRDYLRHVVRSPEVYLVPRSSGRLLIGATVEEAGFNKRTDAATIHRLHQAALSLLPGLKQARILEDWAGLRPGTADGLPILGATSTPGYFVATGHFRDGILLTPITALVMGQVIAGEEPEYDLSRFTPLRFDLPAPS